MDSLLFSCDEHGARHAVAIVRGYLKLHQQVNGSWKDDNDFQEEQEEPIEIICDVCGKNLGVLNSIEW